MVIILRNSGHGANLRVCMGIFTIRFRRKKFRKFLNKNNIPCVNGVLFVVSLSPFLICGHFSELSKFFSF